MRSGHFLLVLFLGVLGAASGQKAPVSAEARREILAYQLNMERAGRLISVLPVMTKFFIGQPRDVLEKWAQMTPNVKVANLQQSSQAMGILKHHGLNAKDYVIGVPALRLAVWRAEGVVESPQVFASPANLAFAKANLAQLRPKWEAVDGAPRP